MNAFSRTLVLAAATAAAFSTGGGVANAACAGTAQTIVICAMGDAGALPDVDPTGSSYDDCVYLGSGPCTPVSVPLPTVTPGSGQLVIITCGGQIGSQLLQCNFLS